MGSVKVVLRGRIIALQAYLRKHERNQTNNLTLKATRKTDQIRSDQSLSCVQLFATP